MSGTGYGAAAAEPTLALALVIGHNVETDMMSAASFWDFQISDGNWPAVLRLRKHSQAPELCNSSVCRIASTSMTFHFEDHLSFAS
jgi:hypothetical protein